MKMKNRILKSTIFCLCLMLFLIIIPIRTLAAEASDSLSLTLFHKIDGKPETGVEFSVYRVADEKGSLTDSFKGYSVSLKDLDSTGLKNAAETLAGYVIRDRVKEESIKTTDANGVVKFSIAEKGIYLVMGKSYSTDTHVCNIGPILLSMPNKDENGNVLYDVKIDSKFELVEKDKTTQMSVVKVWKDKTEHYRPSEVEVQLIDNASGKVQDTVTLNKDNNWRYTWTNLPVGHVWSVIEKNVPEYYTVSSEREGFTVELTNTSEKEYTPPEEPVPDSPEPGKDTPSEPTVPSGSDSQTGSKLPQTGTLWWPVPVLAALGLVCIVIGLIRRQKDE